MNFDFNIDYDFIGFSEKPLKLKGNVIFQSDISIDNLNLSIELNKQKNYQTIDTIYVTRKSNKSALFK